MLCNKYVYTAWKNDKFTEKKPHAETLSSLFIIWYVNELIWKI